MTEDTRLVVAARELPERARAFTIIDADTYRLVAEFLLGVKDLRSEIAETFDPHIARAYEAHRALCKEKRDAEAAAVEAETIAKTLLATWDDAQARRVEEQRQAREAIAQLDAAAVEDEARAAEAAGDLQRADELRGSTRAVPAVIAVASEVPKVEGIAYREVWSAKVTNLAALVHAAATHEAYVALLKPNTAALDAQARSLRERLRIPGVEAVCTKVVAAGRR
jgi:hypothetical protein